MRSMSSCLDMKEIIYYPDFNEKAKSDSSIMTVVTQIPLYTMKVLIWEYIKSFGGIPSRTDVVCSKDS